MKRLVWLLVLALVLAGCDGEPELAATRDAAIRKAQNDYQNGLATAHDWNTYTMGIPAAGWLAIILTALVGLVILGCVVGYWWKEALTERRANRHRLAIAAADTERERIRRGACTICGAAAPSEAA
jgi:hypothetical protein